MEIEDTQLKISLHTPTVCLNADEKWSKILRIYNLENNYLFIGCIYCLTELKFTSTSTNKLNASLVRQRLVNK